MKKNCLHLNWEELVKDPTLSDENTVAGLCLDCDLMLKGFQTYNELNKAWKKLQQEAKHNVGTESLII